MSILSFYFSPKGRANRFDYWVKGGLALGFLSFIFSLGVGAIFGDQAQATASGIIGLVLFWPYTAIAIKRCHDRDKSGWYVLLFALLPIIGWVWGIVELGFLKGSPGENRFGSSVEMRQMEEALKVDIGEPVSVTVDVKKGGGGYATWEARRASREANTWPDGSPRFGRRGL